MRLSQPKGLDPPYAQSPEAAREFLERNFPGAFADFVAAEHAARDKAELATYLEISEWRDVMVDFERARRKLERALAKLLRRLGKLWPEVGPEMSNQRGLAMALRYGGSKDEHAAFDALYVRQHIEDLTVAANRVYRNLTFIGPGTERMRTRAPRFRDVLARAKGLWFGRVLDRYHITRDRAQVAAIADLAVSPREGRAAGKQPDWRSRREVWRVLLAKYAPNPPQPLSDAQAKALREWAAKESVQEN